MRGEGCAALWLMTWRFGVVAVAVVPGKFVADNFVLALLMLWLHMQSACASICVCVF